MSQTIKARLRELVKQQEKDLTVDEHAMDVDAAGEDDKTIAILKGEQDIHYSTPYRSGN